MKYKTATKSKVKTKVVLSAAVIGVAAFAAVGLTKLGSQPIKVCDSGPNAGKQCSTDKDCLFKSSLYARCKTLILKSIPAQTTPIRKLETLPVPFPRPSTVPARTRPAILDRLQNR